MLHLLFIHRQDRMGEVSFPSLPFSCPFVNSTGLGGGPGGPRDGGWAGKSFQVPDSWLKSESASHNEGFFLSHTSGYLPAFHAQAVSALLCLLEQMR